MAYFHVPSKTDQIKKLHINTTGVTARLSDQMQYSSFAKITTDTTLK